MAKTGCKNCGGMFTSRKQKVYCSRWCMGQYLKNDRRELEKRFGVYLGELKGESHPNYKGGTLNGGYHFLNKKLHHRTIMEEHLGRKLLPEEVVHHINENKLDNRIENLQIVTPSEHTTLHNKTRNLELRKTRVAEMQRLKEEGLSLTQIARTFGLKSGSTIHFHLAKGKNE